MNDTLNLSRFLCPDHASDAATLIRAYYPKNLTFDNKFDQLALYGCQYGLIVDLLNRSSQYTAVGKAVAVGFGLFGCIVALLTFSRREYAMCVTMMYHRAINGIEIFNALLTLQAALNFFCGDQLLQYQAWAYFSAYVAEKLRNCLLCWVNLIVLWVAVERVLACLFSRQFDMVNEKRVAMGIIIAAGFASTIIFLPYGFGVDCTYDNKSAIYKLVQSNWAKTPTYAQYSLALSILMICHPVLLFLTSLCALAGLVSMAKRKKALAKSFSNDTNSSNELLRQCSLNIQLCVLQMCETIPCVANVLLFAYLTIRYVFMAPLAGVGTAPQALTFKQATDNANETVFYLYLATVNGFGVLISHFCRFYWYLIFSPKVRFSFWAVVTRRDNIVTTETGVTISDKPRVSIVKPLCNDTSKV